MFSDIIAGQGGNLLTAILVVAIALVALLIILWMMRARAARPFMRGGKNRQPRLAVLDAAAVDAKRRLVLIRRDDVEHLIMIGGPSDIVVENDINTAEKVVETSQHGSSDEPEPVKRQLSRAEPPIGNHPGALPSGRAPIEPSTGRAQAAPPANIPAEAQPVAAQTAKMTTPPATGASQRGNTASPAAPATLPRTAPPSKNQASPTKPVTTAVAAGVLAVETPKTAEEATKFLEAVRERGAQNNSQTASAPQSAPTPAPASPAQAHAAPSGQPDKSFDQVLEDELGGAISNLELDKLFEEEAPKIGTPETAPAQSDRASLEDEMSRLIGEISTKK